MSLAKLVGFCVARSEDAAARQSLVEKIGRVLSPFPWLRLQRLPAGDEIVAVAWGHGDGSRYVHAEPRGEGLWLLAGANRPPDWSVIVDAHHRDPARTSLDAGLEGIFALVRIAHGVVELWNDWTGAAKIYVWHGERGFGACTLEPVAVLGSGAGPSDVSPASVYSLMRLGSYLGTMTLYRSLALHAPDSHGRLSAAGLRSARIGSIRPTQARWSAGWDDVIDEWHALFGDCIGEALAVAPRSTLMLSGGIDSRLIAAYGRRAGHVFEAVSYGNRIWQDTVVAGQVARALGIPLTVYPIDAGYLARYTRPWCEWFGASMAVHGMYQMPALEALRRDGRTAPITTGFTGDPLEGMQTATLMAEGPPQAKLFDRLARKASNMLDDAAIARLLPWLDLGAAREALEADLERQWASWEGADYQRMWLLFQHNRVFQFSSYQPAMYDTFCGVVTPFVHARLASFTLSLPRYALEGRRTVYEMIKRHFPDLARLPGTYDHPSALFDFLPARYGIPLLLGKRYLARAAVAYALPRWLRRGPLREFDPAPNAFALDALRTHGAAALYPLDHIEPRQQTFFDPAALADVTAAVLRDRTDLFATARLWPIQALLHRLCMDDG